MMKQSPISYLAILLVFCILCGISHGYSLSGTITDNATSVGLDNVYVSCWNEDLGEYTDTWTNPDGSYSLNANAGWCHIQVQPGSVYAWSGDYFEVSGDISNLDYALLLETTFEGRLIDSDTGEAISGVEIGFWNDDYRVWRSDTTDPDGSFYLDHLPPGSTELELEPDISTGYSRGLPDEERIIFLNEGQNYMDRWIALPKGTLVTGRVVDPLGNPIEFIDVDFQNREYDLEAETDSNGEFMIRLPIAKYSYKTEWDNLNDEDVSSVYQELDVTSYSPISLPDITCYTSSTGNIISGSVVKTNSVPNSGVLIVLAFDANESFTLNEFGLPHVVGEGMVDGSGNFEIATLPPGLYNVILLEYQEILNDTETDTVLDTEPNVPTGTTTLVLENGPGEISLTGTYQNSYGEPVGGVKLILIDETNPSEPAIHGVADTLPDGTFTMQHLFAGNYTLYAFCSHYNESSTAVTLPGTGTYNIGTQTLLFSGEKQASDLNGDGRVDINDFAEFASQWYLTGTLPADMVVTNQVDLDDLIRWAELWLWKAAWMGGY